MMKSLLNKGRFAALLTAAAMLCGCTAIPDHIPSAGTQESSAQATAEADEETRYDEVPARQYVIDSEDFSVKLNAEGGSFEGNVRTDGEFDGKGYIVLDSGMKLQHIVNVPSSQQYCIAVAAHSYDGAVIRLRTLNETVGAFYVPAAESTEFTMFAVDCVYLSSGPNILGFEVIKGSAALDYITVTNSTQVDGEYYKVSGSCAGSTTAVSTLGLMKFFRDSYGKSVIVGQNVTPGSNSEIEALEKETGRKPAMRTGDLMFSTPGQYEKNQSYADEEIRLALEWGRAGGIVSFNWHWYSPSDHTQYYADTSDFILGEAVTDRDISMANAEELAALRDSGIISDSTIALVNDIDAVAEALKQFRAEGIPVVFQPLPDGDGSMYWWSGSVKNYKWLWNLMFDRMDKYHCLNNLIWVWNGSDSDYYPGADRCDIIGQSFYESSGASFAGRFEALAGISGEVPQALAVTACDRFPSPDYMRRDNAMWLWFSIGSGECIITTSGELSEKYNSWQSLHDAYNSEICVTLDELPDFQEYAFQE